MNGSADPDDQQEFGQMPKPRLSARSINKDRLVELRDQGADSDLLTARLAMIEDEGMRKDLGKIKGAERCYPEILPTQASLRWSTKNPNLGGFVREFWQEHSDVIHPDPGEWWLEWDFKGIEARIFTAYTGDPEDIVAYSTHKTWCGECGHAHNETDVLAGWNIGGGGVIRSRQINERAGRTKVSSDCPADDRQGCRAAGGGAVPDKSSDLRTPVSIPRAEGLEADSRYADIRQHGNRMDDDSLSVHEPTTQGTNPGMSNVLESAARASRQSVGVTCCTCECTNRTFSEPDIHTLTCLKYLFEWRRLPYDWKGKDDERRVRAKNFRYGVLQYGMDEKAILGMPGIESLGLSRNLLIQRAQRFLDARPKAAAWKAAVWKACVENKVARTFMGHRRLLFGDEDARKKEGLNHMIQGSVANLMAWCLIEIDRRWPAARLILNKHDGAILAFPDILATVHIITEVRAIVEREWEVGQGVKMSFPADWKVRV